MKHVGPCGTCGAIRVGGCVSIVCTKCQEEEEEEVEGARGSPASLWWDGWGLGSGGRAPVCESGSAKAAGEFEEQTAPLPVV